MHNLMITQKYSFLCGNWEGGVVKDTSNNKSWAVSEYEPNREKKYITKRQKASQGINAT